VSRRFRRPKSHKFRITKWRVSYPQPLFVVCWKPVIRIGRNGAARAGNRPEWRHRPPQRILRCYSHAGDRRRSTTRCDRLQRDRCSVRLLQRPVSRSAPFRLGPMKRARFGGCSQAAHKIEYSANDSISLSRRDYLPASEARNIRDRRKGPRRGMADEFQTRHLMPMAFLTHAGA